MTALVIGGGPAGLMAAEALASRGHAVALYDAMPSVGRKFLLAGKGGMNLTHSEPFDAFVARYGARADTLRPLLAEFGPEQLRAWAKGLGIDTFVGTSGRVFPTDFKAAPLLRAWLRRLRGLGVTFHVRKRWQGWTDDGRIRFDDGETASPAATVLALGGASWPQLGSDGAWTNLLGIPAAPLKPANCGFDIGWSEHFRSRFAGQPLKTVALSFAGRTVRGEAMVTETGIEGGALYALSAALRDAGSPTLLVDLKPDWSADRLAAALAKPRGSRSLSTHLHRTCGLDGVAAGLAREVLGADITAAGLKALPLKLAGPRPIAEAISTAGGVRFEDLDHTLMLKHRPGVFIAGEMLDWEAPTGGYLLTGCFATGLRAGLGAAAWLA